MELSNLHQGLNFQAAKLLILGDVMLDQYWFGGTSRISPEAPVPVVQVGRMNECPGGAANVALGISALGAHPFLLGLIGQDEASFRLEKLLSSEVVNFHLERVPSHPTITKLRVLSRNQQMIRLDTEKNFPKEVSAVLRKHFQTLLQEVNTVILSDYGKGTLADSAWFIQQAKARGVKVVVDPKSKDFSIYRGADIITPNLKEFEAVAGHSDSIEILVEKARRVLKEYEMGALVITRSEQGISVITQDNATHLPAVAREVHDVTGAGDTVIAVLGTAISAGLDLVAAAHLGNIAAGISVAKLGAATVSLQEIQDAFGKTQKLPTGVMTEEALLSAVRIAKANGEHIVFTNGCFDILHSGHVLYLEQAKRLGDRVIVAVNTDASVARLKGPTRPINSVEDRMAVLAGLRSVDWVVPFSEDTPERIIQRINPHVLVKGGDYQRVEELPGAQYVLSQGGKVQLLGIKEGCSTSRVIEKMMQQDLSEIV
jgi:D-beta-D-heptose 7-phosphate kinase / D-beta-D-heptose 1-phosphate adenosyltransferase